METKDHPGKQVLLEWEKRGQTVKDLYDALVNIEHEGIADKL